MISLYRYLRFRIIPLILLKNRGYFYISVYTGSGVKYRIPLAPALRIHQRIADLSSHDTTRPACLAQLRVRCSVREVESAALAKGGDEVIRQGGLCLWVTQQVEECSWGTAPQTPLEPSSSSASCGSEGSRCQSAWVCSLLVMYRTAPAWSRRSRSQRSFSSRNSVDVL